MIVRVDWNPVSSKDSMGALFMSRFLASMQRESEEMYSTPTKPFLLSTVTLPHMVSPENTQVSGLKRNDMSNPASHHRSARRKRVCPLISGLRLDMNNVYVSKVRRWRFRWVRDSSMSLGE